ncbi:Very-long-chain aldehyde decarbonylase cer1 [Dionaea muscipula]
MASTPGILTDWPWKQLGNYKHVLLAPCVIHSVHELARKGGDGDLTILSIFLLFIWRVIHAQIWISLSRYQTAKGKNRIIDKSLEFEQVDRERNWDDQILLTTIIYYLVNRNLKAASYVPLWRLDGAIIMALVHAGPVEFLYYWFHRALHHHYLYSRYHSHHHSSIVTEPITSVIHPFAEIFAYFILFSIPQLVSLFTGTLSIGAVLLYVTYIDFMNYMGHCNFEIVPKQLFSLLPPLKHLMYTPSFHSLHHTQFRTNYSLFMPFYDYIYGTMDIASDSLHKKSLERQEETPDVVHLTHLTTPQSVYHLNFGFASIASWPLASKWYLWTMWPITVLSMMLTWIYGRTFIVELNSFKKLKLQSWAIPRYTIHYSLRWQREAVNNLIQQAIQEADDKGVKVLSLGLLNKANELNRNGELYIQKHPELKLKIVDGSSLAVALVLNSIPKGATQVLFRGKLTKVAYGIAFSLCRKGIQVAASKEEEYEKLKIALGTKHKSNLIFSKCCSQKIWLVGEGLTEDEQLKALKGTAFIPFSQFPPKKLRKNCIYLDPPAMVAPSSFENLHTCENWLPRRVISAWRVAGIVHALEGWNVHECGDTMLQIDKVWQATLRHGFHPLPTPLLV